MCQPAIMSHSKYGGLWWLLTGLLLFGLLPSNTALAEQALADQGAFVGVGGPANLVLSLRPPTGGTVEIDGVVFSALVERLTALEKAIHALYCPPGSTDGDRDPLTPCMPCGPGIHTPEGSFGACDKFTCAAGTTDHDSNASTPCVACGPGHYIPTPGATGHCSAYACASGHADLDNNPATPCLAALFRITDAGNAAAIGYYRLYDSRFGVYAKIDEAGRWADPLTIIYHDQRGQKFWTLAAVAGAASSNTSPGFAKYLYFHRSADGSKVPMSGWEVGSYEIPHSGSAPAPSFRSM